MRASRLVSILLLLQSRGGMTAAELAEELEVSVRTVYRDVEALSESGVPIYAERGPGGGVRLVDGYRTRLTGLTSEEAENVFLSGLPGPAAQLGLGTVVAAARLKVLAALPPELRARASRIAERFHLDAPTWFQPTEPVPHLETLAAAVWGERQVEVDYARGDKTVHRVLEPLGIVLKGGIWYLLGRSDGQLRTYRVSRVLSAALRDERFERPRDFDLGDAWTEVTTAYEQSLPNVDVTLRVDRDRLEWLEHVIGPTRLSTAIVGDDPERAGWARMDVRLESIGDAADQLMRFGGSVEVLAPAELREKLVARATSLLGRYGFDVAGRADDRADAGEAGAVPA
jgi:predicted DNA-binding transcriptional regulator YafY